MDIGLTGGRYPGPLMPPPTTPKATTARSTPQKPLGAPTSHWRRHEAYPDTWEHLHRLQWPPEGPPEEGKSGQSCDNPEIVKCPPRDFYLRLQRPIFTRYRDFFLDRFTVS